LRHALIVATVAVATQASAQVTFYENEGFAGRTFTTAERVDNFQRYGFNDRASSVEVLRDRWELCDDAHFAGRCVTLRPGRYPSLSAMGLNDRVSSVRLAGVDERAGDQHHLSAPLAVNEYQRRGNERLFQAHVISAHAVFGPPEQRCWVEREQVSDRGGANVPGAIAGAIIGGVLGHQVGGGRGQDIATAGGAVAGAAVGANVGREGGGHTQDVQHCASAANSGPPQYWDVTYDFRGQDHHVQMTTAPGPTVTVNEQGEPRA
jgi:uncharacterized protein YcfJ